MLQSIYQCLRGAFEACGPKPIAWPKTNLEDPDRVEDLNTATEIIRVLQESEKSGEELRNQVARVVGPQNWTESLAKAVLHRLEQGIRAGMQMRGPLQDAFTKAVDNAIEYTHEHPVYTTVVALGILVILLPWVIEALGFAELGPVEGSFAAWWQARYLGYVPKGSLFSYFQRLGMVWKRGVAFPVTAVPMVYSVTYAN